MRAERNSPAAGAPHVRRRCSCVREADDYGVVRRDDPSRRRSSTRIAPVSDGRLYRDFPGGGGHKHNVRGTYLMLYVDKSTRFADDQEVVEMRSSKTGRTKEKKGIRKGLRRHELDSWLVARSPPAIEKQ